MRRSASGFFKLRRRLAGLCHAIVLAAALFTTAAQARDLAEIKAEGGLLIQKSNRRVRTRSGKIRVFRVREPCEFVFRGNFEVGVVV